MADARTVESRDCALLPGLGARATPVASEESYLFDDSHFHLTNYVQQGTPVREFLRQSMGTKAGRVALFGIPR